MAKPPPLSPEEARAFEEAMRGARRLEGGPRRVSGSPPLGAPPGRGSARRLAAPTSAGTTLIIEAAGDVAVRGRAPDVSARVLRELASGEHRPEARLDLHGRTREEALREVERFVARARAQGHRVLLVIHGRGHNSEDGEPVLRPALHAWLASAAAPRLGVMAFAPAPVRAGGTGATIVLLRR